MIKTLVKLILGRGTFRSYSQFGEDAILNAVFRGKKQGRYVDVGAYHPHLYSNTYALYKRGWSGVCIDPNPEMEGFFHIFRPRDSFICAAIGTERSATYYQYEDGAYNGLEARTVKSRLLKRTVVPVRPLASLIHGPVDLLNVDVEGLDLDVLKSYDWSNPPRVIAVEGDASHDFLLAKNYSLIGKAGLTNIYRIDYTCA